MLLGKLCNAKNDSVVPCDTTKLGAVQAASVCGGRGFRYGISIDFCLESLLRSGFRGKEQLWIDVFNGLIVT